MQQKGFAVPKSRGPLTYDRPVALAVSGLPSISTSPREAAASLRLLHQKQYKLSLECMHAAAAEAEALRYMN